jgi:hypothetical protein
MLLFELSISNVGELTPDTRKFRPQLCILSAPHASVRERTQTKKTKLVRNYGGFMTSWVNLRAPISQDYELYNALKRQGAPVRMLAPPRQARGPTELKTLLKIMQTNVEWFDKMIGGGS